MKRMVMLAFLVLAFAISTCQAEDYHTGLGTSNFEVGIHAFKTLEISKPAQFEIAMIQNTGTVNLTINIIAKVTFTGEKVLQNPDFFESNYYGKELYTNIQVEHPFFIVPNQQVRIFANVTLGRIGTYEIQFNWQVQTHIPYDHAGRSLSTPGGKATAKLVCGNPPTLLILGLPLAYTVGIASIVIAIPTILASWLIFRRRKRRIHAKIRKTESPSLADLLKYGKEEKEP